MLKHGHMQDLYLLFVVLFFVLAISDLIVGVSNDAVNFLNSAIGSKVASRKVILTIAGLGILAGATFSSGMMEVARKGIFNPEYFVYGEIMIIFLAVMITDILLLDFFNTIGLPTSTTVSIVFELLGAAVAMAAIKVLGSSGSILAITDYINSSQATIIISGIFLSIGIAFVVGAIAQMISRLLFSFHYEKANKLVIALWSGASMTAMTYFLVFKGIKGASFVDDAFLDWIQSEIWIFSLATMAIWTVTIFLLLLKKINVFRPVVLFGTFSLAMAFASNDLVNFIGVPIAGFESYLHWTESGQDPFALGAGFLREPVRTSTYLLLLAGMVMTATLWLSSKARSVTDTEVNLGRQDSGHERFAPNLLSRSIVQGTLQAVKFVTGLIPATWKEKAGHHYRPVTETSVDKPAFDLIRASVNLTTASILIAYATSLKLPLSTTYVSFMVAMGSSLADKAWGRDSAVFRVAGVLNVIGGWFTTAFVAFLAASIITILIYYFNITAIILLILFAIFFVYRSFSYHQSKERKNEARISHERKEDVIPMEDLMNKLSLRINSLLDTLSNTYDQAIEGLIREDKEQLHQAAISIGILKEKNEELQDELYESFRRISEADAEGSRLFLFVFDYEQDIVQSADLIVESCDNYVKNLLSPLKKKQVQGLKTLQNSVRDYLGDVRHFIANRHHIDHAAVTAKKKALLSYLEMTLKDQVAGIKTKDYKARNSRLMFRILLETKDLVAVAARFVKLYKRIRKKDQQLAGQFLSFEDELEPVA